MVDRLEPVGHLRARPRDHASSAPVVTAAGWIGCYTSNFSPNPASVAASYSGLSRTVGDWRRKDRQTRRRDADDFWGGVKEGEAQ